MNSLPDGYDKTLGVTSGLNDMDSCNDTLNAVCIPDINCDE